MSAYLPTSLVSLLTTAGIVGAALLGAFVLSRASRFAGLNLSAWILALAAVCAVERVTANEPSGFRMLALVAALLAGMKGVVTAAAVGAGQPRLGAKRWFAFALAWPGMRPEVFRRQSPSPLPGASALVRSGTFRIALGLVLLALARASWLATGSLTVLTLLLLPGLSLMLHFGIFDIIAGGFRTAGFDCRPLFRSPLAAPSLRDFWARRWNLGFSELVRGSLYRPLVARFGKRAAVFGGFLFSGLLHELAISVPARGGYGLPTLYFALHGVLVQLESRVFGASSALARSNWARRVWTLGWVALPLPLVFHRPFLQHVLWPIVGVTDPFFRKESTMSDPNNWLVWTYLLYLAISIALTVWVARTLHKNGRVFLVDSFLGNTQMADSVNHLLMVGFYLINVGYVTLALKYGAKPSTLREAIEFLSTKVGLVLLVLGAMHFFNLSVFSSMRRRALLRHAPPPVEPSGFVAAPEPAGSAAG